MYMIKLQILSMAFLISIFYYYSKNRNLRTSHNLLYKMMIIVLFINIIFDMITVYTVNNILQVPYYINDISHRIFIFTLDLFVFLLYVYMLSYARCKKNIEKIQIAVSVIPIIISFFMSIFGPLYYMEAEVSNYSYGPAVDTIYISITFYILDIFYHYIRYRKSIDKNIVEGILRAVVIEAATGIIQFFNPSCLISSGGQILVIFILFLSFENVSEFMDKKTGLLNINAFIKVLKDKINRGKPCYIIAAYLDEIDENKNDEILINLDRDMYVHCKNEIYRLYSGCFAVIAENDKTKEYFLHKIKDIPEEDTIMNVLPDKCKDVETVIDEIKNLDNIAQERRRYFDESTGVRNRNAYERKLCELNDGNLDKTRLWGIIVDVNNLKRTNDSYGHDKGDYLIQRTAKILVETFCDCNKVYRIGGDEFAVFLDEYTSKKEEKIIKSIKEIQSKYNIDELIKVEFSIGCSHFDSKTDICVEDMMKRADRNMYINKRKWHKNLIENGD